MKKIVIVFMLISSFGMVQNMNAQTKMETFTLTSRDIGGQIGSQQVLNGFGCTGDNLSPELSWINAPDSTKSFAITIHDPDAPTGSGWWHWVVFDIPSSITELMSDASSRELPMMPEGAIESMTDFGEAGYNGPCPPKGHGLHAYVITIYALSTEKLGLDAKTNPALVGFMINRNLLAKATIVAYYKRD